MVSSMQGVARITDVRRLRVAGRILEYDSIAGKTKNDSSGRRRTSSGAVIGKELYQVWAAHRMVKGNDHVESSQRMIKSGLKNS